MKKVLSGFVILFLASAINSVSLGQTFEWARKSSTNMLSTGADIATDSHGNTYVAGTFIGTCSFGDHTLASESRDIYLVKYDPQGKVLWAKSAGGRADDFAYSIALNSDGDCYLAGSFAQTFHIGADSITAKGYHDMFVAKYDSKGELLWTRTAGGYYDDHAVAISVDKSGNCYVGGFFKDTMWIANTALVGRRVTLFDMFLAKYDEDGKFQWATTLAGSNYQTQNEALAMVTDRSGSTYLTGFYQGEAIFDGKKYTNRGGFAMFLAKYDDDGKFLWVRTSNTDASSIVGRGIALDKKGNCYVAGTFTGSATLDSITIVTKNLGYPDMFLAKYTPDGNVVWVRTSASFGFKSPYDVAVDGEGDPYVFGTFRDTASFGPITVSSSGTESLFLVKYASAGVPQWAKEVGRHGVVLGKALSIDKSGDVFITGNFTDTAEFGKAHLEAKENTQDMFFAKLSPRQLVKETKLADPPGPDFTFISCSLDQRSHTATIKYSIPKSNFILLEVYDIMGTVAESFIEGQRDAGTYEVKLDMKSFKEDGDYYCRLQAGKDKQTKKLELTD
ncbi:MAG: hypothetical protein Q8916_09710 [Bacteroidota bacterium]|nr:hypothetical protein [Bacteroidota bacterium]MDP4235355.1 hypothetical protein [Bacteroidota bacterium]